MKRDTRPKFRPVIEPGACETIQVDSEDTLYCLINKLAASGRDAVLICRGANPIALVSGRDIIDLLAARSDIETLTLSEIKPSPVVTVQSNQSLELAYQRLTSEKAAYAVVIAANGKPLGVLSPTQLLQRLHQNLTGSDEPVSRIMRVNVIALASEDSIQTAIQVMSDNRIGTVVVRDKSRSVSLFTAMDCIRLIDLKQPLTTMLRDVCRNPARLVNPNDSQKKALEIFRDQIQSHLLVVDGKNDPAGIVSYRDLLKTLCPAGARGIQGKGLAGIERFETRPAYDRLQHILNVSPASIYVLRPTGLQTPAFRVSMISPSIAEITGFSAEEWVADKSIWIDHLHPADRKRTLIHQVRLVERGTSEHQYRFRHKNGSYRWIHNKWTLIRRSDGSILEVIGSCMDITRVHEALQALRKSEEESRTIFMTAPECILKLGRDGRILSVNKAGLELLQALSVDQLLGELYFDMIPEKDRSRLLELKEQVFHNKPGQLEHRIRGINGRFRWVETRAVPMLDELNRVIACLCIARDITSRRDTEDSLRKLSLAVEHNPCAIMITNAEGQIEYVNPKFTSITEYELSEIRGQKPNILGSGKIPPDTFKNLWETIQSGKEWHGELLNRKKSGHLFWSKQSIAPVFDQDGQVTHYVSIQEDFSKARKLTEQLNFYARYDPLTRLVNRYEFEQRIGNLLESSSSEDDTHVLCYLDLDQFKVINDSCGHLAGDELLRQIADLLSRTVRRQDVVARLGGDEFAILMQDCPINQGCANAERILEQLGQFRFLWEDCSFGIGVSIGVVPISSRDKKLGNLLKKADQACYSAKDAGRNRVQVYHENDLNLKNRSSEIDRAARIRQNLDENRFQLYAQRAEPLQENSQCRRHYEILLRMLGQDDQLIAPGAFLPTAQRYDLISRIDHWVLEQILDWIVQNPPSEYQPILFVNISGATLSDPGFLDWILAELEKRQLDCGHLGFEITETAAISNFSRACRLIDGLKSRGALFALDDFGSGVSSFGYLKNLNVDFLKIDGAFVKAILKDPIDLTLVSTINQVGHVMGKKTIAEQVENNQTQKRLQEIGVDFAQGYAIERPQLLDAVNFD